MLQLQELAVGRVRHAFFTRRGGVSRGLYTSLNCGPGSSDDPESVRANRSRAMAALDLPAGALRTVHQVHGRDVIAVDDAPSPATRPKADALVTRTPGVALGVLTADCAPVLFADPEAGVVGAAHAGWRGALAGVVDATVEAMIELGARHRSILAAVGPCIGQESYEVGPEFPGPFLAEERSNAMFFSSAKAEGKFVFDLSGYVARRLARLGLGEVFRLDCDTCRDEANFFSYRRSRLRGEADYGRALAAIALAP